MLKHVKGQKIRLEGFNNLTKSLSFNIYEICYARSHESQIEYLEYIDDAYNSNRPRNIIEEYGAPTPRNLVAGHLDFVELDEEVVAFSREHLSSVHQGTFASQKTRVSDLSPDEVVRRIAERGIRDLRMIDGASWAAMQVALPYIRTIPNDVPVITDADPSFPDHFSASGETASTPSQEQP